MRTIVLLTVANVFMTFAWYGHLKWFAGNRQLFPFGIVVISWGIAFFEYCFQVPANRIGEQIEHFSLGQLKIMQEVITLAVFAGFSVLVMRQKLSWNYFAAFALMIGAVFFIFMDKLPK